MQGESGSAVRYDGTDGDRVHSREMPGVFFDGDPKGPEAQTKADPRFIALKGGENR